MATFDYEEWLTQVPESIKQDPLWNFQVYPKALLLSDLAWEDTDRMMKDPRGRVIAKQLVGSVGSISANIEEGHGRGFGKENAYFQRVALGQPANPVAGTTVAVASRVPKCSATAPNYSTKS
ncbi:MAG: four helix bundle protein [Chloroflexota bacterium]|nr:four helix bundle protein [Chloroflexota bacterium]